MGYAPNEPAVIGPDHANVVHLTKMCQSFYRQCKSKDSSIASLSADKSHYRSLASSAVRKADVCDKQTDQYASMTANAVDDTVSESMSASSAVSQARSNEALAELNADSAYNASLSASRPSVSEATDNLVEAIQRSMDSDDD